MKLDWLDKLRRLLQTIAFCLAIAGLLYAFNAQARYEIALVYSLCIGISTWALIDFGVDLFASAQETGWPQGIAGVLLPVVGNALGIGIGITLADAWFGWSSWGHLSQRELLLNMLVCAVIGTIITFYFYSRGKSAHLERKVGEARHLANEARLKLLESQLEPHMLFNTLANLRVLIATDPKRAQTMLDNMIAFLRATLCASRTTMHPLQAEFDRLRDYLELMAVRMGPRLSYQLLLPDELAAHPVPTLILQPLVENAIKHGLEPKVSGGHIIVSASVTQGLITLEVQDNGVGVASAQTGVDGFGLAQVRERLNTLYGPQENLKLIADNACGTRARVTFPYKE
jgi:signal transduction histidine kinase